MMKFLSKYLFLITVLTLTACHSSRHAGKDMALLPGKSQSAVVSDVRADKCVARITGNVQDQKTLTARMKMRINAAGKDVSVNGNLRMRRDDVIQLSLTVLGFEVGRLEFSPDTVLMIDRYNKQYVRASYADVVFLRQAGLDFHALQALFWCELFVPGEKEAVSAHRFSMSVSGEHTLLALRDAPKLDYVFTALTETAQLDGVTVKSKNMAVSGKFEWLYSDFVRVDGKPFPARMVCSVTGLGKDAGLDLSLSKIGNDTDWEAHTRVSGKYAERNADELLRKMLGK